MINKKHAMFLTSELHLIDFNIVLQTSADMCRKSIDGTKTFVEWSGDIVPDCVLQLTTIINYYDYEELHEIVSTSSEWNIFS